MHIVDVSAFYAPTGGGVRTYVEQKLTALPALGHSVTVVIPGASDELVERAPGARILSIRSPRFPLDRAYRYFTDEPALHAALDRLSPDFVEVSSPWRSPSMVARWRPGVPRALVMHADPLATYAYRWFGPILERDTIDRRFEQFWRHLRTLGGSFDTIVCASSDLGRRLSGGGVSRVVTIPMGVSSAVFSPARRDPALRARLLEACGLPDHALLLVAAGRLSPEKRLPMLVRAATLAGREHPVGLAIFGQGRERQAIIQAIGGNPHVRLFNPVGERTDFARILASSDALLHGCESETFCMAAAEARASGIPVIAPDAGGAAEQATPPSALYRAAAPQDAARAILVIARGVERPAPVRVRSMDEHFADLVAHYQRLSAQDRAIAA